MIMCVLLCYPVSIRMYYQQGVLFLVVKLSEENTVQISDVTVLSRKDSTIQLSGITVQVSKVSILQVI